MNFKACSSKIHFSKSQVLCAVAYENRIDKPLQTVWSQLSIKILAVDFVTQ